MVHKPQSFKMYTLFICLLLETKKSIAKSFIPLFWDFIESTHYKSFIDTLLFFVKCPFVCASFILCISVICNNQYFTTWYKWPYLFDTRCDKTRLLQFANIKGIFTYLLRQSNSKFYYRYFIRIIMYYSYFIYTRQNILHAL